MRNPAVIAVSGVKNSGKTALIAAMLPHLAARAWGTTIFDGEKYKVVRWEAVDEAALITRFPETDLILLEGFKHSARSKLEVVYAVNSAAPMSDPDTLLALVTDLPLEVPGVPALPLGNAAGAAVLIQYVKEANGCD